MKRSVSLFFAFLQRDFLHQISYRTAFVLELGGIFVSVSLWYFVSGLLGKAPGLEHRLGGYDYFPYVLFGIAFQHYLVAALNSFSQKIRQEQLTGTLEALLATPAPVPLIILFSSVWDFAMTTFRVLGYLVLGYAVFGIRIHPAGLAGTVIILPLAVASFAGIGILSAAFILYLKRGDPINFFLTSLSGLLGGVFFPPEIMPGWLSRLSQFLPITHALKGVRACLLHGSSPSEVWPEIRALLLFLIVLLPLGFFAFSMALRKAREEGSLVSY